MNQNVPRVGVTLIGGPVVAAEILDARAIIPAHAEGWPHLTRGT